MKAIVILVVAALAACGGQKVGGDGECDATCDTTASLMCANAATCVSDCEQLLDGSKAMYAECTDEIDAYGGCSSSRPVTDWECNAAGDPMPKSGVCGAQYNAMLACIAANP